MLMITFVVLTAVGLDTGYAKVYLGITSNAVMIFSQPPLGESSGSRSIWMTSSGSKSHSGILMSSGINCEVSILLSWTQVWHSFTQLRT